MRAMKDSGIPWIGEIPVDWRIIKLKYLFSIIGGNGFPDALQGNATGDYPFCKVSDINGSEDYVDSAINWVTQQVVADNGYNVIPEGSILMAKIGAALAKNHRKINRVKCCIDNNTQALVPKRNDAIRYLLYLSKCIDMRWFDNNSTVPSINNNKLLNLFVPDISSCEQSVIARFLDAECARIDAVMEQTRASIEEYKKLKQSIITEAVTKGIRPNRPMKDSGIDWIGQIPADWSIQRIKNIADIFGRIGFRGYTTDDIVEEGEGAVSLSPSNIQDFTVSFERCTYISWDKYYESPEIQINEGDIIFVKTGSSYGKSGYIIELPVQATINPQLVVFKNIIINHLYFLYFLQTPSIRNEIESIVSGGTIPTMGQEKMRNFHVCIPSMEEQCEIADYISGQLGEIKLSIERKEQLLVELESYKKSLIYEYVTGKKEVV